MAKAHSHFDRLEGLSEEQAFDLLARTYLQEVKDSTMLTYQRNEEIKTSLKLIAKWLTDTKTKSWLLLIGNVGAGKTTVARATCRVLNFYNKKTKEGVWQSPFVEERAEQIALNAMSEEREKRILVDKVADVARLFLDDIGVEQTDIRTFANTKSPVENIIKARYCKKSKPITIITTNLSMRQIEEVYGLQLADRLEEMCEKIIFRNQSFRRN